MFSGQRLEVVDGVLVIKISYPYFYPHKNVGS
jgi:hypothetical protein